MRCLRHYRIVYLDRHSLGVVLRPEIGRPSIDPVLMIRMLIVGYVFGIRSERALCREAVGWLVTSSARPSKDWGTDKPSAFAVFRLTASSYLFGACTGRSAGFAMPAEPGVYHG